jgi:hypothetical protein
MRGDNIRGPKWSGRPSPAAPAGFVVTACLRTASPLTPALPLNRSATVLKASRSASLVAAAGLRHSRAPVLGFKARTGTREILSLNRSATVLKASRSAGLVAAAGLRHSRAPVLGFKARTWAREFLPPLRGEGEKLVAGLRFRGLCLQGRFIPETRTRSAFLEVQVARVASPSPLNGERIRRTSSLVEPLNPVGTRSTASPISAPQSGTQWNASLPVPAGRFMERAGVRGEAAEVRASLPQSANTALPANLCP